MVPQRWLILCGVMLLVLAGCSRQNEALVPAPLIQPRLAASATATPERLTITPAAIATAVAPTAAPPPATSTPAPTATPAPPRVGIQVGHWKTADLPDELARFRTSTGAYSDGTSEAEVNLDIAQRVALLLEAEGIVVDLLPATLPVNYQADAFITIHADGSTSSSARGFKMATPWRTSAASQQLYETLLAEYAAGTGLPQDGAITVNMRGYYAFNWRRHRHAIAKTTPAVIIEMGYLTNSTDRAFFRDQPDRIATSIAAGVRRYLTERDLNDKDALIAREFTIHRAKSAGATVHATPSDSGRVLFTASDDTRFMPFREQNGWYEGVVRGEWRVIGWVRAEQWEATDEPFPTPTGQ
ncbi:MAG: N-acetylmuramoyl-L-alanine amidase [Herpetosiphonaceae bacterium]|nr:N-acetylmuramoyl-L-alanine amidase [Herpetosiphonaceae bacterium]